MSQDKLPNADQFERDVKSSKSASNDDLIKEVNNLAKKHFGADYESEETREPFGMQFRKKVPLTAGGGTGTTATVSVTIAIPPDTDTDPADTD
jgi:hypothetical protein